MTAASVPAATWQQVAKAAEAYDSACNSLYHWLKVNECVVTRAEMRKRVTAIDDLREEWARLAESAKAS